MTPYKTGTKPLGRSWRHAGIALLCAVPLTAWDARADPQKAGDVVAIHGDCLDRGAARRIALKVGDPVFVGDVVDVPAPARLRLRMIDGSMLSVASGSRLTIAAYGQDAAGHRNAALDLASGLLRALVAHVTPRSRFEVKTATGTAAVRSTDWFVTASNAGMQVGVLLGRVALTSAATGREVVIPARWGARIEPGLDPVPPRLWSQAEFAEVIARTDMP